MSGVKKAVDVAFKASKTIDWEGMEKILVSDEARREFTNLRRTFDEVNGELQTKFSQEPEPIDWDYCRKGIGGRSVDMYKQAYESMFGLLMNLPLLLVREFFFSFFYITFVNNTVVDSYWIGYEILICVVCFELVKECETVVNKWYSLVILAELCLRSNIRTWRLVSSGETLLEMLL